MTVLKIILIAIGIVLIVALIGFVRMIIDVLSGPEF